VPRMPPPRKSQKRAASSYLLNSRNLFPWAMGNCGQLCLRSRGPDGVESLPHARLVDNVAQDLRFWRGAGESEEEQKS
jgi:hypothetical protein